MEVCFVKVLQLKPKSYYSLVRSYIKIANLAYSGHPSSPWRLFGKWQSQPLVGQPLFRRQLSPYFPVYDHHYLLNCHQREFAQHACHKSTKNICSIFKNHKFTNICPIFELPHISGQQTGRTVTDADYAFPCTMFGIQR